MRTVKSVADPGFPEGGGAPSLKVATFRKLYEVFKSMKKTSDAPLIHQCFNALSGCTRSIFADLFIVIFCMFDVQMPDSVSLLCKYSYNGTCILCDPHEIKFFSHK